MQLPLFGGWGADEHLNPPPLPPDTWPRNSAEPFDEEDTCSELREAEYQEALWRFFGPRIPPHECYEELETLKAWDIAHRDDPCHPRNLTRYHPAHDTTVFTACLPTGKRSKKQRIWVLISAYRLSWATQFAWNINTDKAGGRYPRRKQHINGKTETLYLYREIMRQMLTEDADLRAWALRKFKVQPTGNPERDANAVMAVAIVHHRNHDPEDNRDENLTLATHSENRIQGRDTPGASGFVGVHRVSVRDASGHNHWAYKATATRAFTGGRYQTKQLGVYASARLALLARCVFLLTHPSYLPQGYTPRAEEATTWAAAKGLVESRSTYCPVFGSVKFLPKALRNALAKARKAHRQGRRSTTQLRP